MGMGAEAVRSLLEELDLEKLRAELREEGETTKSQTKKKKITKSSFRSVSSQRQSERESSYHRRH